MATNITARLSSLRKEKGLSQKEAAAGLGVSQALLSHYENGIRECGLDFLCRAADYYNVTTDYLLKDAEAPPPQAQAPDTPPPPPASQKSGCPPPPPETA